VAERIDTIIIGGGQAGLALSYYLTQQGREHVVLEQDRVGESWRTQRWDSFGLVTPNWMLRLPGFPYRGDNPDGFLPRQEIVNYLEEYAVSFGAPVRTGVRVAAVEREAGGGFAVTTDGELLHAANVVVATGTFRHPKVPDFSTTLPQDVLQLHSGEYRRPDALPPGAVLVVGSAQSGCQIGEELYQSGRQLYLCVGSAGRVPRRYRGRDVIWWLDRNGFFNQTTDSLPSPRARFAGNPHLTGKNGGHTINLHQFARDGVVLLGRLLDADGQKVRLAPDLKENLAKTERFEADLLNGIDRFVEQSGMDASPPDRAAELRDGYEQEEPTELDLKAAGVKTIVWAHGFGFDFSWVRLPVFDSYGYPVQSQGVTDHPGLYFLGLNWLHSRKSALFCGVGEDAAHVAAHIATRS
jgi:putative flavoprotein involved in K+ transport